MLDIEKISPREFDKKTDLWRRIEKLKDDTSSKGAKVINGNQMKDKYENTAASRQNKTYRNYAREILDIWLETRE